MPQPPSFSLDVLGSLLDADERARVSNYALSDDGGGVDAFGVSKRALTRGFAAGRFVHRQLLPVHVDRLDVVPARGPAIVAVVAQEPSLVDMLAVVVEVFGGAPKPRLVRTLGDDRWASIPYVGTALRGLGQVPHNMLNAEAVLVAGHMLGVHIEDHEALSLDPQPSATATAPHRQGYVGVRACLDWSRRLGVPIVGVGIARRSPEVMHVDHPVAGARMERWIRRGMRRATGIAPGTRLRLRFDEPRVYQDFVELGRQAKVPDGVAAAEGMRRMLRRTVAEASSDAQADRDVREEMHDTHG